MKKNMTQEQKSLFESLSQNDKTTMSDLELIWDKSASYEPKISFNKEAAYSKFMKDIQTETAPAPSSEGMRTILLRSAIAIGLAAAIFLAYTYMFSYKTIKTTDSIEFAMLDDGTEIWLNKHSELRYPRSFDSDARKVTLKGEAFFNVSRDEKAPFSIELSNDNLVTVLGTSFNINDKFGSKVEVSVAEGKVNLQNTLDESLSIDLTVGQRGILNANKKKIESEIFDNNFLAWKESELVFQSESLESVLEDVGTFYGVQFKLDNAVAECPITITVNRDVNIEQAVSIIKKPFSGIKITKATDNLYYVQGTCK
ncbi:MAG: FecR domain-containing protein [Saprospiraceae bacterium]